MTATKFTGAQKAFIIWPGEDGTPGEEIFRKAGNRQRLESIGPPAQAGAACCDSLEDFKVAALR
jgi:hypothetical protein